MAHSHGNTLLEAAMQQLSEEDELQLSDYFGQCILLAADVSRDALNAPNPLHDLVDIAEHVQVYYHRHDTALVLSEKTKNPLNPLQNGCLPTLAYTM
jgi:esterase/lipase superfamily enzyme